MTVSRLITAVITCAALALPHPLSAQQRAADGVTLNDEGLPQYSTFSLCAIDPVTGQSGAGVTTRVPFVGRAVPHVRAGVECQRCHGPVERMRVVGAATGPRLLNDLKNLVGLRPPSPPLTMGWCLDCHREQNATRSMHAPLDCVACHH